MHLINIVLGLDYKRVTIGSNLDSSEILAAYQIGADKLGLNVESICSRCNDNIVRENDMEKLNKAGIKLEASILDCDTYMWLWLEIAKLGNNRFEYQILTDQNVYIGGYGLFD